jgi:hypothetical protein
MEYVDIQHKMNVKEILTSFKNDETKNELKLVLPHKERRSVHELCEIMGLYSVSSGPQNNRVLTVSKKPLERQLEITDDDRQIFIKNNGLPIPVWREPYFSYFIDLYKDIYDTQALYEQFKQTLGILNTRNRQVIPYSYELMKQVCDKIKNCPIYKKFQDDQTLTCGELPDKTTIYVKQDGDYPKYYVSLDIIKANFNTLRFYDAQIVSNCETWEDFIGTFTDLKYFATAKYFRQACLGQLKTGKFASIQLYLLSHLYSIIKDKCDVLGRTGTDEIIITVTKDTISEVYCLLSQIIEQLPLNMRNIWRIECCSISPMEASSVFIKTTYDRACIHTTLKTRITNIEKDFHAQAYKHLISQPLTANDFKAMKDNYLITYEDKYVF